METRNLMASLVFITFLVMVTFGLLTWMQIPVGGYLDWVIGVASFWWLMIIVTMPWNMHFRAKEILNDVEISENKGINVNPESINYAKGIAKKYLIVAIALHIASAGAMALLSFFGISPIGYLGAVAALLLTILRPAIRLHEYIVYRLNNMKQEIKYPRDDVYELLNKVGTLENRIYQMETMFDENNADSWLSRYRQRQVAVKNDIKEIRANFETLKAENKSEHDRLAKKAEDSLARLSEDAQFLGQVKEIIRFFKNA